jgi:hypothetical protein
VYVIASVYVTFDASVGFIAVARLGLVLSALLSIVLLAAQSPGRVSGIRSDILHLRLHFPLRSENRDRRAKRVYPAAEVLELLRSDAVTFEKDAIRSGIDLRERLSRHLTQHRLHAAVPRCGPTNAEYFQLFCAFVSTPR